MGRVQKSQEKRCKPADSEYEYERTYRRGLRKGRLNLIFEKRFFRETPGVHCQRPEFYVYAYLIQFGIRCSFIGFDHRTSNIIREIIKIFGLP